MHRRGELALKNENGLIPVIVDGDPCLRFEFPGLRIGAAEYAEGPTGCTVLHFPEGARCEVDVRGGAPGLFGGYCYADAICFAGGSFYGLEAVSGVAAEILHARKSAAWASIACVSGAVIYDFGRRSTLHYPDKLLGQAAFRAAAEGSFPIGRRGAGVSASVGKIYGSERFAAEDGGQGAAVKTIGDLTIAVFTVVNSVGAVLDEDGTVMRGFLDLSTGRRHRLETILTEQPKELAKVALRGVGNTTLTAVVVNKHIPANELRQLGRQVHSAMARVIQPFHTLYDGDILFALSVGEDPASLSSVVIGEIASNLACAAVRSAVVPHFRVA